MKCLLGLGQNEIRYGQYLCEEVDPGVVGLLSVGSDPASPSAQFKGNLEFPNEDAFLILADESTLLMAVADSHFGHTASHEVLRRLAQRCARIPRSRGEVALMLLGITEPPWDNPSATTLLVAILDRRKREGFCYHWGDSSLIIVSEGGVRPVSRPSDVFVHAGFPPNVENALSSFALGEKEVLVAFTDGINECHYRCPETSVTPPHLLQVFRSSPDDPKQFACSLMGLALAGVEGNPGGQDNIALVVAAG